MLHFNIHFLYQKIDEIKLLHFDKQLDVLCFYETFLNDSFSDHEPSINNYNMFRRDRGTIGGELVIFIKDIYHCTRRSDLESISLERICLETKQHYLKPLLVCYSYRPPSCNVSWLSSDFSDSKHH